MIRKLFQPLQQHLAGKPSHILTLILLLAALVLILIAIYGKPLTKAGAILYVFLP